jgi:hypothetical protein
VPKLEVNVDSFAYHGPAPAQGQPRPLLFAHRGQVVDLPEDEAQRARDLMVGQVYPDPAGGGGSVRRLEPAGIPAGAKSAAVEAVAEWNAERERLRADLARLEANAPLVARDEPAPTRTATIGAPSLPPSLTGVRVAPPMVGGRSGTPEPADDARAETVVAFLNQHPDQLDAVDAAEQNRKGGPRKTVIEAIENHRRAATEREQ